MIIVSLPFIGFLLLAFARYIGKRAASSLAIGSLGLAFILSLSMFKTVYLDKITLRYQFEWIQISSLDLNFTLLFDPLSTIMTMLVTLITLLVMIYSYGYLNEDPALIRFLSFLSFFCFAMLTMVTAGNYVQFFLGWETVGLASYLLISYWTTRNEANQGGLKAVVVNRIGDVFFMFALGLLWTTFKSFDFGVIFNLIPSFIDEEISIKLLGQTVSPISLLGFCLLVAAAAKSAQVFLHTWLPDAMEGPTPVSSLLHSATMVTAGVYLIIRSSFIFVFTPNLSLIMAYLGILTAVISGLTGTSLYDMKRIIAFSTCSQLGFMVFACGLGYYNYAFFHLLTHAFFKCLLFLCSGAIIHALSDEQDMRKVGNLFYYMPVTFTCMFIATLALTGFPMMSGFYSKDLLLETAFISSSYGFFIYLIACFAAFLTSFYSIRSLYFIFFRSISPINKFSIYKIHEAPYYMLVPMIILTLLAIVSGYLLKDLFTGFPGLFGFRHSIANPLMSTLTELEYEAIFIKILPTIASLFGTFFGLFFFGISKFFHFSLVSYLWTNFANQKFYFDIINNSLFVRATVVFGYLQYKLIDRGYLELFGPTGLTNLLQYLTKKVSIIHSGYLLHYLLFIFSAIIILLLITLLLKVGFILTLILLLLIIAFN